jgi:hypothetical protein
LRVEIGAFRTDHGGKSRAWRDNPAWRSLQPERVGAIDVPLTQATQAGHAFAHDHLEERLVTARRRLAALFEELANP